MAALKYNAKTVFLPFCLAVGTIWFSELHMYNSPFLCGLHLYSSVYSFFHFEYLFYISLVNIEMQGMIPALKEVKGLWERQAYKQIIIA